MKIFNLEKLNKALLLLDEQLQLHDFPHTEIVVCGGSSLIASQLVNRTTQDVDVVALMHTGDLISAEPMPSYLEASVARVAAIQNLPPDWLNNGPASQFNMGLPPGFVSRLHKVIIGEKLTVYYISRTDQIYFKTFASADRGGYHIADLQALSPNDDEIHTAALWCMEQDVSEGFRFILKEMLTQNGWKNVADLL